jgi:hypothetical protein
VRRYIANHPARDSEPWIGGEGMSDCVLASMLKKKIPLTQRNYRELAYMGDKHSIEELGPEERAELPKGFEDWPRSERDIH